MLWGAGLEGSPWLELGTVVLTPASDSAGDLWSFFPVSEPGAICGHARSLHEA